MFRSLSFRHLFPHGSWCFAADDAGGGGDAPPETPADGEGDDLFAGDDDAPAEGAEQLSSVMEMLADEGIKLPEDTTPEDFIGNLETALIAYRHAKQHHGIDDGSGGGAGDDNSPAPPAEEPMSTQMSIEFDAMKSRLARAEGLAAGERLRGIKLKLQDMTKKGMVSAATANAWWKDLSAKQLSLVSGDDRTVSRILDQMDILEKEHPNRLLKTVTAREEPAPEHVDFSTDANGKKVDVPDTPEKARKLLDEIYGKKTA